MTFTYTYSLYRCGIGDGGMKLLSTCMKKMVNLQELKYVTYRNYIQCFVNIHGCPTYIKVDIATTMVLIYIHTIYLNI